MADRLGIDFAWEVELHFLQECSHSSGPEVFLAARSQRTISMRLGHGIVLMPPSYNHPPRVAERIATLDFVPGAEGTGQSASAAEMGGFGIDPEQRHAGRWSLYAEVVMPAFKQRHTSREQKKQEEVVPYIERAPARRTLRPSLRDEEIPAIVALGQQRAQQESLGGKTTNFGRGGEM